jgi:hypothetical protein
MKNERKEGIIRVCEKSFLSPPSEREDLGSFSHQEVSHCSKRLANTSSFSAQKWLLTMRLLGRFFGLVGYNAFLFSGI